MCDLNSIILQAIVSDVLPSPRSWQRSTPALRRAMFQAVVLKHLKIAA